MKQLTQKQYGFTLLELIVVVGLLGLITSLATDYMVNETNQTRYKTTEKRIEKIKYALVGDSSRTLNGEPDLSGFVHDMGRLPLNLDELVDEPDDCNPSEAGNQTCKPSFHAGLGRVIGWRGPYIQPDIAQSDGWGFTWQGDISAGTIESYGLDGIVDDVPPANAVVYENDTRAVIQPHDYLVQLSEDDSAGVGLNGISITYTQDYFVCSDVQYETEQECLSNSESWNVPADYCAALEFVENGAVKQYVSSTKSSKESDEKHGVASEDSTITFPFYMGNEGSREPVLFPFGRAQLVLFNKVAGEKCGDTSEDSNPMLSARVTLVPGRAVPPLKI
ncbi:prepilin-type N-terminal cleavage/methylation domain-containing protein [Neptunomonas sp. XY-337]|uniref:type II secretion system protein n=1 Tax=Neptunomonas sp. XY-337 TaxID=2561897 RepID=UPI0010AA807A|nr:prepilin-type N-terminal cleavage/methylation domain-containing protein [Neptunomonas sp. XY-337]